MLPAPTTTSPASSTALIGARRRCSAAWNERVGERRVEGLGPQRRQQLARPAPSCSDGDQTTAPKRRGSVSRSVPRLVTRSKWSCGPGGPASGRSASEPDMPRCSSSPPGAPPPSSGSHRYLPRRATGPTEAPASCSGATPSGQRSGLPSRAEQHPRTAQRRVNAPARDLDFREFGHPGIM